MNEHTEPIEPIATPRYEAPTAKAAAPEVGVVPDAVKQSSRQTAKDRLASVRGRGIEWVRASDLITRGTSGVAGAGIRFHQTVGTQARHGLASGVSAVSRLARELPPVSAFGRRNAPATAATRSGVGMR
ncbi:hypothetical protein [Propionibacterium freudenreichii]|uniref:hypothetical protein n=1 Tax=Propionibacterium freudenreichii TaxID=1744 RepID=UPI0005443C95|nr:hypothetical protein [Propionibacterium freudenreichii]MCT2972789.1 hypothetical protein [Propionibacterium freudenreichii]MCT2980830.1 hypothetical protein [Propionibacterium freudenreichii]MDK9331885.1 hypothetical protein [Propionibacterium freudenreichii]CEG92730.1 Putative uncharacterized protein [Propionibacterium freudenreichii]